MENASKALLMAGEILIGVIILSIFAYAFQKMFEFAENYQDNSERQKIVAFNTQYTKYQTGGTGTEATYIYSEDVVTLTEQVLNWNNETTIDSEKIELYILDQSGGNIFSTKTATQSFDRENFLDTYKLRGDPTQALSREYKFSCKVQMDDATGRVNRITIQIQGEREK